MTVGNQFATDPRFAQGKLEQTAKAVNSAAAR
jgi:hypothetical protein